MCLAACLAAVPATQPAPTTVPSAPSKAVVIPLSGEVNDYTRDDLLRRFEAAKQMGAKTVILRIDTYGGLVTAGLDISRYLRDQNDIHTIAFVKTKAISAGALIAIACDEIVMSPGAQLGDCAPIIFDTGGQIQPLPAAERAKEQSPVLADFAASARRNGYDPLVAEAMVRVETVVHVLINDKGEKRFVDDKDDAALVAQGWKPAPGFPDPIDGPDTLLTVGPAEATLLDLSKGTADSVEQLAQQQNLTIAADLSPGAGDRIVELLGNPWIRSLLITAFIVALNIALHAPGHGAAEATAMLCLAVLLGIPMLTGYAQWWEILVILAGLALCAFEIFVFPGHGLSLALGILTFIFGMVMTFVAREPGTPGWLPNTEQTWNGLRDGLLAVLGGIVAAIFLSAWLRRYLPSIPYFKRLILTETSGQGGAMPTTGASADVWPFVGTVGSAVSELKPGGSARFPFGADSRIASVVSANGFVPPGKKIAVLEVHGSRIVVRAID